MFAPTSQAFTNAGFTAAAIAVALTHIPIYHVVPSRVFSTLLTDGVTPATLPGPTVRVNVSGTGVTMTGQGNGANTSSVTLANIQTTNTVVHVINRVLLPPP